MSILIRGMEMPKSCSVCKLFGEYGCPFVGAVGYALTRGERNKDCPLVPVPPHGRCIDADALYKRYWAEERTLDKPYIDYLGILATESPTIIPAEEGET